MGQHTVFPTHECPICKIACSGTGKPCKDCAECIETWKTREEFEEAERGD